MALPLVELVEKLSVEFLLGLDTDLGVKETTPRWHYHGE